MNQNIPFTEDIIINESFDEVLSYMNQSNLKSRKSPRRSKYDYTSPGGYFITICTAGRQHYFGEIIDGNMKLNELGKICEQQIKQIEMMRSYINIHEFIVMPNHVHLLLIL
jgi:putative transposase